jgi:hypothetical protein
MDQQQSKTTAGEFTAVNKMATNNYLFTPPEHPSDSFSSQEGERLPSHTQSWECKLPPIQGHTPPASPDSKSLPSLAQVATGFSTHDPQLYPDEQPQRPTSQTPLFRPEREASPAPTLSRLQISSPEQAPEKPRRSEIFPTILGVSSPQEALEYWYSRVGELKSFRAAVNKLPSPKTTHSWRDPADEQQLRRISRSAGITKQRSTPKQATKPKASAAASADRPLPPRKRTPKVRPMHDFHDGTFTPAQQAAKHKRAPPSKKVEHDNVNWSELPNYAPPLSTLDGSLKPLKAIWHGSAVDLSTDPDREHLHPQELVIAATLRLSCAQYLSNKRKIFQARLQSIKDGKNFTKTAAQGACSIDVNKASQLWEAFDRVGWLKESWFQQYL